MNTNNTAKTREDRVDMSALRKNSSGTHVLRSKQQ